MIIDGGVGGTDIFLMHTSQWLAPHARVIAIHVPRLINFSDVGFFCVVTLMESEPHLCYNLKWHILRNLIMDMEFQGKWAPRRAIYHGNSGSR